MIKEAIDRITELVKASVKPEPIATGDPSKFTFLSPFGVTTIDRPRPSRSHFVSDLDSLVTIANRFAKTDSEPVIWVNESEVVLVLDDESYQANKATLVLDKTSVFKRIESLAQAEWLDQKAFVRLLRFGLTGALPPGLLLDRVRKIRFENSVVVSSEKTRDKESLGRDLSSRLNAGDELPDDVALEAKVYRIGEQFAIACGLDVDPGRGLFQLLPLPDEVERVRTLALHAIADSIHAEIDESVPVYFGSADAE